MRKRKNRLLPALAFLLLLGLLSGCGSKRVKQTDETALGVDVGKFQGTIDWQKVVDAFKAIGFDGYLTAEVFPTHEYEDMNEFYRETTRDLGKIIALA